MSDHYPIMAYFKAKENPAPAKPDVGITNVWLSPANAQPGQSVEIWATIKNFSGTPTPNGVPVGIGYEVDGSYFGHFFVQSGSSFPPLNGYQSFTGKANVRWNVTSGRHTFRVIADDVNRFEESNETNNARKIRITF